MSKFPTRKPTSSRKQHAGASAVRALIIMNMFHASFNTLSRKQPFTCADCRFSTRSSQQFEASARASHLEIPACQRAIVYGNNAGVLAAITPQCDAMQGRSYPPSNAATAVRRDGRWLAALQSLRFQLGKTLADTGDEGS